MSLEIGQIKLVQGSAKEPYKVKNVDGDVYSCTCLGWKTSKGAPNEKACKHTKAEKGVSAKAPVILMPGGASAVAAKPTARAKADVKVLLAEKWEGSDPTGYFLSEKLDGCRCVWDGTRLLSRLGNEFPAPQWFLDGLPAGVTLDGELWLGRGLFQECVSIVKSSMDKGWGKLTYMVFDLPEHRGPFEARMAELERLFPPVVGANARAQRAAGALGAHVVRVQMVSQVECQDNAHLLTALENVIALGGEGLMLRKPGSHYEGRRSSTLLKLKRMHDDEATVISYLDGKGKHEGSMGALHCRLASGVEFDVGSGFTDKERDAPPRLGSKITFRYQEITRDGVPRFPVYLRPHHDV